MRRLLSIAVLFVLALPFFAPLLALAASVSPDELKLPACCRRLGAHHCAMSGVERARLTHPGERTLTAPEAPCPFRSPQVANAPAAPYAPAAAASAAFPQTFTHATSPAQAEAFHRIARERARHKRGPPSLS